MRHRVAILSRGPIERAITKAMTKPRPLFLNIRISSAERAALKALALADDVPASTYLRHLLRAEHERRFGTPKKPNTKGARS